jgi:small conductance mechanosensitive channel
MGYSSTNLHLITKIDIVNGAMMEKILSLSVVKYSIIAIAALLIAFVISKILRSIINRFIRLSSTKLKADPTQFSFLKNAVTFIVFFGAIIFIFYTIPAFKSIGITLFAGAGIIAAIAAFASQQAFSNIVSGIFIVMFKPFRVNDIVDIGNLPKGRVEDITLRHTVIRNYENRRMIIPNSVISSEIITNSSIVEEHICNFIEMGISYDSDVDKAMEIMKNEAIKHPNFMDNRTAEEKKQNIDPVMVRLMGFGDSSVNLRAFVWSKDHPSGFKMKTDLYKSIKEQFDKNNIEIPFPYRTLVFKNQSQVPIK